VLEYLGLQVSRLIRTAYGPFVLGDMPPGEVGEVRQHDLVAFRNTLKKPNAGSRLVGERAAPATRANAPQAPLPGGRRGRPRRGTGAPPARTKS